MKLKHYLSPSVCSTTQLESEHPILGSSQIDFTMAVDPLDEEGHYYDGTEATDDYLIVF